MPVAPYIPAIAGGIGSLIGRRSAQKAGRPGAGEQQANTQQAGAGSALATAGGEATRQGQPLLNQAGGYFSSLAGGDRAKMGATLAPDVEGINKTYAGSARSLRRFLRGPDRDYQLGELERERAGGISSLFRTARTGANEVVARLGQESLGRGAAQTEAAGSIFANLAGRQQQNRYQSEQLQRQAGVDYGGLFANLLTGVAGAKGKGPTKMPAGWGAGTTGT